MRCFTIISCLLFAIVVRSQQVADSAFIYRAATPAYALGAGPVVALDHAHHNFHRIDGRYMAFARVLEADGYTMKANEAPFTAEILSGMRILVIANALGNDGPWVLPTAPAFTKEEVVAVEKWVRGGGSLFLIADHMPFGGAAARLARAFGFNWVNGYAMRDDGAAERFSRDQGTLAEHPITSGASTQERVDRIAVFTGSAFLPPPQATRITDLQDDYFILLPESAGQFSDTTAWIDGRYFANAAALEHGKGRVVCFGEAAMFSAQRQGPDRLPMGMNQSGAEQNPQLLLNIMHWLDRRL
ncbi:MAG: DUF4350 domain-containing protein [Flavobacteriales bacterium]|nr:MAG: DUF4350 domain-containing protein [Flavobacteriales bacterium]